MITLSKRMEELLFQPLKLQKKLYLPNNPDLWIIYVFFN